MYNIVDGNKEDFIRFVSEKATSDKKIAVLCGDEKVPDNVISLPYGSSSEEQGENLFSSLRKADEIGCSEVYVKMPEKTGFGLAVYNRLLRAAAFRIIEL